MKQSCIDLLKKTHENIETHIFMASDEEPRDDGALNDDDCE